MTTVQEDLRRPPSRSIIPGNRSLNFSDSNFGTINRAYIDDNIEDRIELNEIEAVKVNDLVPTMNEADYEDIEAEVRFDGDSIKYFSTDKSFRYYERTSPQPFSNEDYLQILPFADSRLSSGASSTEALTCHNH